MSEEHLEILRRAEEAFQRGDLTAALADMDEDITASRVAPMPDIKTYKGHEGIRQMLLEWVEGFDDFAMTAEERIDVNDRQVFQAFDLKVVYDKIEKRIEISATVSETVAEAFTNAKDLPEEVHRVAQRDIAGAGFEPATFGL